jgi:putative transcription factor
MQCDICGKEVPLVKADIEGTTLNVCANCGRFGKVLSKPIEPKPAERHRSTKPAEEAPAQIIVRDFSRLVKHGREMLELKQEDFAKKINEKISVVHNVESGRHEPSIELARKLERFLKIKLIDEHKEEKLGSNKKGGEGFTIGDIINLN